MLRPEISIASNPRNFAGSSVPDATSGQLNDYSRLQSASPFIEGIDTHTSPSCRAPRVLTSKRAATRADLPRQDNAVDLADTRNSDASMRGKREPKAAVTPLAGKQNAEPETATLVRRRSIGHIVVTARRPQLFSGSALEHDADTSVVPLGPRSAAECKLTTLPAPGSYVIEIVELKSAVHYEELRGIRQVAKDINVGFHANVPPIPIDDCTGGVYYLRNQNKRIAAVFKPSDEEPYAPNHPKQYRHAYTEKSSASPRPEELGEDAVNLQSGIRAGIAPGTAAAREVTAYLLDRDHLAGVPTSVLATAAHPTFHLAADAAAPEQRKVGALQVYIPHKCTADDIASSLFSAADVHAIAALDIRLANQDRHGGNILVLEQAKRVYKLVPIDHGACLPRVCEIEETSFEWLSWSQAKRAFGDETRTYIASLNSWEEEKMLQRALSPDHQLEEQAILTLHVCTALLQVCVLEWNMSAHDIGMLMCRHGSFKREQQEPEQSVLETLVAKSQADVANEMRELLSGAGQVQRRSVALVDSFKRHLSEFLSGRRLG